MRKSRIALASLGLAMILPTASTLFAQAPAAPIPSQILTAKEDLHLQCRRSVRCKDVERRTRAAV